MAASLVKISCRTPTQDMMNIAMATAPQRATSEDFSNNLTSNAYLKS